MKNFYTLKESAEKMGISRNVLNSHRKNSGGFPSAKNSRYSLNELEKYFSSLEKDNRGRYIFNPKEDKEEKVEPKGIDLQLAQEFIRGINND